jgi:hypothetical protein
MCIFGQIQLLVVDGLRLLISVWLLARGRDLLCAELSQASRGL